MEDLKEKIKFSFVEAVEAKLNSDRTPLKCNYGDDITTKEEVCQVLWSQLKLQSVNELEILRLGKAYDDMKITSIILVFEIACKV